MPTYDYVCDNCGETTETFQSIKDEPLKKCPKCGEEKLRRLITGGAGLIFKGSGFYLTDYKNKTAETSTAAPAKSEAKTDSNTETTGDNKKESTKESKTESKSSSKTESTSKESSPVKSDSKK